MSDTAEAQTYGPSRLSDKQFLSLGGLLLLCSITLFTILYFLSAGPLTGSKTTQLLIVLLAIAFQVWFVFTAMSRYKSESCNPFIFHPMFYVNASTVMFFFAPYVFFLYNEELRNMPWSGRDLFTGFPIFKPLIIFCLSLLFFNAVCLLLDGVLIKKPSAFSLTAAIENVSKNELFIWFSLYAIVWVMRILSLRTGTYWHSFLTEEILEQRIYYSRVTSLMGFFTTVLSPAIWFVFSLLYFTRYRTSKRFKTLFLALAIIDIAFHMPTGSKLAIITPLMGYFSAGFITRKRGIAKQLIASAVAFTLLLPAYSVYRQRGGVSLERTLEYTRYTRHQDYWFFSLYSLFDRADFSAPYLGVVEQLDDFKYGETYLPALVAVVPRPLWPSKPGFFNANEFSREYGLIWPTNYFTAPPIGYWTESYMNFGYPGLFGVSLFLAITGLGLFKFMLRTRGLFEISLAYYAFMWFLLQSHSLLGKLIASILKFIVVFMILKLIMRSVELGRQIEVQQ